MPYRIAGIDVHKKKLAVVVSDVEVEEEYLFERRWYGSNPEQLQVFQEKTRSLRGGPPDDCNRPWLLKDSLFVSIGRVRG